jgi:hypothetical protein
MADAKGKKLEFRENALLTELLARGAENAKVIRGFIGPSSNDSSITLHQSLDRLGDTVEIPRDDVLYLVDAPRSELGAVILWVKDTANVSVRRTQSETVSETGLGVRAQEVTKGRLRMRLKPAWGGGVCTSVCERCITWCDCAICSTLPT